jgi:hypothetical protein
LGKLSNCMLHGSEKAGTQGDGWRVPGEKCARPSVTGDGCGSDETGMGAVPVEAGPAAWVRRPRGMCVFGWAGVNALSRVTYRNQIVKGDDAGKYFTPKEKKLL